jgi:hypothetical protein
MSIGIGSDWNEDNAEYWKEQACEAQSELERFRRKQKNNLGKIYKKLMETDDGRLKIALHAYILLGGTDQVRLLLSQKGVDPNWKNPFDENLPFIFTVVKTGNAEVFQVFCDAGANLNVRSGSDGKALLDYTDDLDLIKAIISSRIDVKYIPKRFHAFQTPSEK